MISKVPCHHARRSRVSSKPGHHVSICFILEVRTADFDGLLMSDGTVSVLRVYLNRSDFFRAIGPQLMLQMCELLPRTLGYKHTFVTASMSTSIPCSLATLIASTNSSLVPHRVDFVPRRVNSPRSHCN